MSTAVPYKFVTAATTNLQVARAGQAANVKGIVAPGAAAIQYLKLYWFTPTTAAPTPVVGTTVPNLTFAIPTTGLWASFPDGITSNGQLWLAATAAAADTDTAATAAGGIITVLVE